MSKWKKFKLYIFCLGAVLAGSGFLDQLVKIQEFKRKARMTRDPMMLEHHPNCNFWLNAKCTCYVSWVRNMQKELAELRKQDIERKKKNKIPEIW